MMDVSNEDRERAAELVAALHAARKALADSPYRALAEFSGEVMRCAATGVVLLEGDEIVEDGHTGEIWLRSALGLPPRAEVIDEDEDADDESEFEPEDAAV